MGKLPDLVLSPLLCVSCFLQALLPEDVRDQKLVSVKLLWQCGSHNLSCGSAPSVKELLLQLLSDKVVKSTPTPVFQSRPFTVPKRHSFQLLVDDRTQGFHLLHSYTSVLHDNTVSDSAASSRGLLARYLGLCLECLLARASINILILEVSGHAGRQANPSLHGGSIRDKCDSSGVHQINQRGGFSSQPARGTFFCIFMSC